MYIKKATLSDIKQISDSVYEAFKEYELFAIKASNQSKESVLKELFKLNTIAYIQKDSCYVCIENEKLVGNFKAIYDTILKAKPSAAKGTYVKNVAISSTMGPGIKVASESLEK